MATKRSITGRPALYNEPLDNLIFRIPRRYKNAVREIASSENKSMSALFIEMLEKDSRYQNLLQHPKAPDEQTVSLLLTENSSYTPAE